MLCCYLFRQRRSSINSKDKASSNGSADNVDFDRMKQEIMTEMRKEISKMKEEIIEGKFHSGVTKQILPACMVIDYITMFC